MHDISPITPGTAIALVALVLRPRRLGVCRRRADPEPLGRTAAVRERRRTGDRDRHGRSRARASRTSPTGSRAPTPSSRGSSTARGRPFRCGASRSASSRSGSSGSPAPSAVGERGIRRLVRDREAIGAGTFRVHRHEHPAGRTTAPTARSAGRGRVATGSAARRTRRRLPREQEHARDREEEPRDLALTGLAAQPRAQVVVRLRQRLGRARLRELAARRLGDRAQRLRIGRNRNDLPRVLRGAAERPALDDAVRRPQRDRVDGEAGLLRQLGALERLEQAARLGAVGQEQNRDGALLRRPPSGSVACASDLVELDVAGAAVAPSSGTRSVTCLPRSTAVWRASPIAVPPKTRNSSMSVIAVSTSSWSSVGGVATCASPAKTTRPTRRSSGASSRNVRSAS